MAAVKGVNGQSEGEILREMLSRFLGQRIECHSFVSVKSASSLFFAAAHFFRVIFAFGCAGQQA